MSKVIDFPTKNVSERILLNQVIERMNNLETLYGDLDKAHEILNELEKLASIREKEYDVTLVQYAEIVGGGRLDVDMLQYSQNTKITKDPDSEEFIIEWGGTPSED